MRCGSWDCGVWDYRIAQGELALLSFVCGKVFHFTDFVVFRCALEIRLVFNESIFDMVWVRGFFELG
jgi:hypothetical protein